LSADVAAFFIGSSVSMVYFPQKLIHLQPLPDFFYFQRPLSFTSETSGSKLILIKIVGRVNVKTIDANKI
jgi:hypothetical protein